MLSSLTKLSNFFATHPLTQDAPIRAWARLLSWQLKSRIQEEVLFPWIAGQRLAVRHGMTGATGNIYVGLHEFADMMLPLHFLREEDLFLDVGANVGSYTVLASGVCRAKTWAFEPDPDTVRYLKRNIALNELEDLVTVHEYALGPARGEIPFTMGLDTVNKVAPTREGGVRIVRQEQLDQVIGASQPIMIKMDVEGYEQDVLQGAEELLANPCLKVVSLETVTPEISSMMLKNRFERAYYNPFTRHLDRKLGDLKSSNSLFIREWPAVEMRLATAKKIQIFNYSI